jgi:hypothetical protein
MEKVGRAVHGSWTKKVQLPGESRRRPLPVSTILCPAKKTSQQFCRTHLRLYVLRLVSVLADGRNETCRLGFSASSLTERVYR